MTLESPLMSDASPDLRELNPASKEYLEAVYQLEEEGQRILQARPAKADLTGCAHVSHRSVRAL
jgi:hypothetical protein